jgi:hypothetical protein
MRKYCKVYRVGELRQFSGWAEQPAPDGQGLTDDDLCYLWDDWTVVRSPVQEGGVIFDQVTPEWQDFCTNVLKFEVPEDIRAI